MELRRRNHENVNKNKTIAIFLVNFTIPDGNKWMLCEENIEKKKESWEKEETCQNHKILLQ